MVSINANYNAYVDFYNKHKDEFETTGVVKTDESVQLKVDVAQIYNLMKNEGANAVLIVLEQLKAQGVAVDGPHIDFDTGTVTFKIGNNNFELNLAEEEEEVGGADRTDKPLELTPEQIQAEVKNIETQFLRGNMTLQELQEALGKLGILITGQGDATEFPGKYYVEFQVNGKEWCLVADKAAMDDGQGGKTTDVWSTADIKNLGFTPEQMAMYFYCVAWEGPGNAVAYTRSQAWPEGVNTPQELKTKLEENSNPKPPVDPKPTVDSDPIINPTLLPEVRQEILDAAKEVRNGTKTFDEFISLLDKYSIKYEKNDHGDLVVFLDGNDMPALLVSATPLIKPEPEKPDYQALVNKYIDVWVNDFKTGYTRWGLDTPPTDAEVATFRTRLTELCANGVKTLTEQNADEAGVKAWVREQCNTVIKEIKEARKPANTESLTFEKATALITSAIEEVIEEKLDNIADGITTIHTEFGMDSEGNIIFQNKDTKEVYENLAKYVKSEISKIENFGKYSGIIDAIGGEAVLDKLIQAAWMATYNTFNSSSRHDTEKFLKEVLNNLNKILEKVQADPNTLEIFTTRGCYADNTITDGVTHYGTPTTDGKDESISYKGNVTQHADGSVHISNNKADNYYQVTMREILDNIKAKYPNIDEKFLEDIFREAQKAALEAAKGNRADCPYGTGNNKGRVGDTTLNWGGNDTRKGDSSNIDMDQLVQLTLYYFDKMFIEKCMTSDIPPRTPQETAPVEPIATPMEADPKFTTAVDCTIVALDEVLEEKLDNIAGKNKTIHTEFGINADGKLIFQNKATTEVYNNLVKYVKSEIRTLETFGRYETILQDLGGDAVLDALIQAAWIDTYNKFNSSTSHNTEAFLAEVVQNLQEILRAVKAHPERLQFYMMHTAYGDNTLTDGLEHYNTKTTAGDDERISYKGDITQYSDGTVHIADDTADIYYQTTMNALLINLRQKYAAFGDITNIFREAQKAALEAAKGNRADCPYGTGNNKGRVGDTTLNWGGNDSRKGDSSNIDMDQLVQLTLYYFDKLFYEALKAE